MSLTNLGMVFRRTTIMLAAAALGTGLLVGCGGSTAKNENAASSTTAAAESVSIAHKFGETKVPANPPQRVVTVGWNDQDDVLALGVVPVGTRSFFDNYNNFPWVKEATGGKGVPVIPGDEINYEPLPSKAGRHLRHLRDHRQEDLRPVVADCADRGPIRQVRRRGNPPWTSSF